MKKEHGTDASISLKPVLIAGALSLIFLLALIALISRLLLFVDHFERFYDLACYLIWAADAVLIGCFAKRFSGKPVIFSCIVSAIVLIAFVSVGLILGKGHIDLPHTVLRLAVFLAVTLLVTLMPEKKKGRKKNTFKR